MDFLLVFLGGGVGSVLRHAAGLLAGPAAFPWATLSVNAAGSLAIGLFGGWAARFGWSEAWRLAATAGLCGGFTTFSAFSRESLALAESGRWGAFAAYVSGSLALGISAVALGCWMSRQ